MRWLLLLTGFGLASCTLQHGPAGFWSRNRVVHDERQGPWRAYFDSANTHLSSRGHYRHDRPAGRWRYYRYDGSLAHTERYRRHGEISLRYYHPAGTLASRGQARIDLMPDTTHFYWYGVWRLYDVNGRENGWELYDNGRLSAHGNTPAKR